MLPTHMGCKLTPPTNRYIYIYRNYVGIIYDVARQPPFSDSLDFFQFSFSFRSVIVRYLIKGNTYR